MSYMVVLCNIQTNRELIDAGLIIQKSFIAKKLGSADKDLFWMIPELHMFVVSCLGIKVITKNTTLFQFFIFFWDISSFKSKNGDTAKLSRKGFIYK